MADFEVPNPILNRPFDEPAEYWQIEEGKPPLFAPGHEPAATEQPQEAAPQHHGLLGGMFGGGGMMGGPMMGGYYGGGFGQAMAMGMAMNLGANLVSGIFH